MKKESFIYGAAVLVLSSVINRILGFIYQILIIRLIGAEGIGLFSMVYPIYVLLIVLSTAGIPVAVAKFVAEEVAKNNLRRVFNILRISLIIMLTLSILITIIVYKITPFMLGTVFPNPDVYWCFISLLPGVIIVAACSAFRGFFQGLQMMTPTALSQTIEQIVRVICGLFFAYIFLPRGIVAAAVGASLGVVLGELVGLISMLLIFFRNLPRIKENLQVSKLSTSSLIFNEPLIPRLLHFSIPVTLSRVISTIILSIDAILIPMRLQAAGKSMSEATIIYGQFSGMALVLLFIPTVVTISLATSLVPAISDAMAQNNWRMVQNRAKEALRLTIISGIPSLVTFFIIPDLLCNLLFKYPEAGSPLKILAIGGIFLFLQQTTTGILQGLGEVYAPLKNLLIGAITKIIGIFILTGIPELGIIGTSIGMNIGFIVVAILNLYTLSKKICLGLHLQEMIIKPGIAAISSGVFLIFIVKLIEKVSINSLTLTFAVLSQFLIYIVILLVLGGIYRKDLLKLPFIGKKFIRFIESFGVSFKG